MTENAITLRQISDHERRILAALDRDPENPGEPNLEIAQACLEGELPERGDEVRFFDTGRENIDWAGRIDPRHQVLNRFNFLSELGRAYRRTGNEGFVEAALDYVDDWIRAHPSPSDYDHGLIIARRTMAWLAVLHDFRDSSSLDEKAVRRIVDSTVSQIERMRGLVAGANNIRTTESQCLLLSGLRLRGLSLAEEWIQEAVWNLNDAFHRQVLPDGAHVERTPNYHQVFPFSQLWRLQRAFPELGLSMTAEPIARMFDYALAVRRPNGSINDMHDSAGGRCEGARPPGWADSALSFRRAAGLPEKLPSTSQNFPHAGQAFWRDSWQEDAVYVTFDASSGGSLWHCHLSSNAIQLHAYGRSLLVDPGSLLYAKKDPVDYHGRSTRAHNTVNINGWNQAQVPPQFRFKSIPGYDLATSLYRGGYWPGRFRGSFWNGHGDGLYGEHFRALLWVRGRFLLVIDRLRHGCFELVEPLDEMNGELKEELLPFAESNWQFSPGEIILDPEKRTACTGHDDANVLMLFPLCSAENMEMSLHEGESDPLRGWLHAPFRTTQPAPQLCLTVPRVRPHLQMATVLLPFAGHTPPAVTVESDGQVRGLSWVTLTWDDGRRDTVVWSDSLETAIDEHIDFRTDASLVYLQKDETGAVVEGYAVDGTRVDPYSDRVLEAPDVFAFRPAT